MLLMDAHISHMQTISVSFFPFMERNTPVFEIWIFLQNLFLKNYIPKNTFFLLFFHKRIFFSKISSLIQKIPKNKKKCRYEAYDAQGKRKMYYRHDIADDNIFLFI